MLDGVKAHIGRHKVAYSIGSVFVVAGITCIIMRSTVLPRGAGVGILPSGVTNTASQFLTKNSTINIITVVESQKGHPGWPVQCIETGQKWLTQGAAAKALNVSEGVMSGHIQGKVPDVHGLHVERISLIPI